LPRNSTKKGPDTVNDQIDVSVRAFASPQLTWHAAHDHNARTRGWGWNFSLVEKIALNASD